MFGQNNNQPNDEIPEHSIQGALGGDDSAVAQPATPSDNSQPGWGHPGVPIDDNAQVVQPTVPTVPVQDDQPAAPDDTPAAPHADELIDIKQKALTQLSPLVGHLDQTPEEKFRTTMMMIQASDDQSLVPVAYEAANAIEDEKAKAQALLDIVNEINYFTQHSQSQ